MKISRVMRPEHLMSDIPADTSQSVSTNVEHGSATLAPNSLKTWLSRIDRVWLMFITALVVLAVVVPQHWFGIVESLLGNLAHTAIFIIVAVLLIAWLRATGAEAIVGKAFQGRQSRMIVVAALVGGLAPFCSCEVIPFIAALLAMGTPLSAVMAFWLASPIMDPPMFVITASALGLNFAVAKTVAAVAFGLFGGFVTMSLAKSAYFANPLRAEVDSGCGSCCSSEDPFTGKVEWKFWTDATRLETFWSTALTNALFLFKWLAFAYLLEALMIRFVPAEWISSALGGDGIQPILVGTLLGGPAYLNGYAAVPLVEGMLQQGMSQGAAMAFVLAGSVTCIPAAVAVWALVKPRVFVAYLLFALTGSFVAGLIWAGVA